MTMLTSVVQVLAIKGAAHALDLASRSTGVRRARARLPSATLAATVSLTTLAATVKSADTVRRLRAVMVVAQEAPDTVVKSTEVRNSPVTAVSKRALDMVAALEALDTVASRSLRDMAASRDPRVTGTNSSHLDTVARNLRAMEATRMAQVEDVAMVVKSLSEMTGCLVVLAVTMSLASKATAAGRMRAATTKVATAREAMASRATDVDTRA